MARRWQAATAGVSANVSVLTKGVMKAMFLTKLKIGSTLLLALRRRFPQRGSSRPLEIELLEQRDLLSYSVTDLGTFGGPTSIAYGINSAGQVVGAADTPDGTHHAFLYQRGRMRDLGTLGGANSLAAAINDAGEVDGIAETASGPGHAFLYRHHRMQDLGTLGGLGSGSTGVNAFGEVAGGSNTADGHGHPFLYSGGALHDLGILPGYSDGAAWGLNDEGQVVGGAVLGRSTQGFLYSGGALYALGTLGGPDSYAYRINDAGQIVGKSSIGPDAAPNHAFLYDGGQMMDLGTLGGPESVASNLNSCGQIVGSADTIPGVASPHAFLYCAGTMTDLNEQVRPGSPVWTLAAAYGINDRGQIVGTGINPEGEQHAFLLTPVSAPGRGAQLTTCSLGAPGFFQCSTTGMTPALAEVTAAGVSALAGSLWPGPGGPIDRRELQRINAQEVAGCPGILAHGRKAEAVASLAEFRDAKLDCTGGHDGFVVAVNNRSQDPAVEGDFDKGVIPWTDACSWSVRA
jgi:probable HAF family extracellular repeat protein